jgi:NCS1 family nucleobase:cation symporter-1
MSESEPRDSYDPLTPVPAERRAFDARDAFSLWFSLGIGLLVLQAGALLVPGLGLGTAFAAIVVGTGLGVVLLAAAGVVGADTGLSAIGSLRPALGIRGAAVPAVLNLIQLTGWGAFEIVAMRQSADALSRQAFGVSSPLAWTLLFGVLATALAVLGPLSVVRRLLRHWGMWLLLAGAAWLTWRLLARHDLAALFARAGDGSLSFAGAVDLVIAMPLSWLPLIADYTRFGRTPGAMFRGSVAGYFIANVWFYALGACYGLIAGGGDALLSALAAAGGGIALILILIDETDNAFADIFSAAVSTGTLVPVRITRLALAYGALCTVIALLIPLTRYEDFLLLIGSVFAPLFGMLLADHFIVRRRRIDPAAIRARGAAYWFSGGWHIRGLLAWAAGVAAYQAVANFWPNAGATLPSLAVAALAYLALVGLRRRRVRLAG